MAQYVEVNGQTVEFPDGMGASEIEAAIKKNIMSIKPAEPASVGAGKAINSIPRQFGLTARYGMEGLAESAQILTEPLRYLTDKLVPERTPSLSDLVTGQRQPKSLPLGKVASNFADWVGLPKPETPDERVVGDATKLMAGGGGFATAGRAASALPGMLGKVGTALAANPSQQIGAAAGAGLASGASREAGGSPLMQGLAGFAGGVAGGTVPGVLNNALNAIRSMISPAATNAQLDGQIAALFATRDIDYSAVPERVRQSLRTELRSSLQAGKEINPDALARLADFRATGLTPTRGMVSQNPVQITREQNLAKIGANSANQELHGLPMMQNQNNAGMIRNLNELGAGRADQFATGQRAIDAINSQDQRLATEVSGLYTRARNMAGGDIPVDRAPFVNNVYGTLARENKLAFLPENISGMLDQISAGQITRNGQTHQVPFNAETVDTLKTMISTAQRGTSDGNVRAALMLARRAIDDTPVNVTKQAFGGNQVMPAGLAERVTQQDAQPAQFMDALNQARAAAAQRFGWQESSRPVERALGGAQPDKFFRQNVISGSLADTQAFVNYAGRDSARDATMGFLRDKALNSASDEVGKFSQSAFNKALHEIGDRKLSAIFAPEELAQLRALGRASSYAQVQPVGSAINNSNSGTLILGRGADLLENFARKFPMGQQLIADPLRNINISLTQRQAENVLPGLLSAPVTQPGRGLLAPGFALGGLLSAPVAP